MSDQKDAVGKTGLEQSFAELLEDLESLELDLYKVGFAEDSFFIDNIVLRLKVWASAINIQDGTLATISRIGPLATRIQSRLDDIRILAKDAGTSSTHKQPLAENKDQFLEPLDSLAMFVEPIKTIMTRSPMDGTDHANRIEAHLRTSQIRQWMGDPNWYWLAFPFEEAGFPRLHADTERTYFALRVEARKRNHPPGLLGAIVTDPRNPNDTLLQPNHNMTDAKYKYVHYSMLSPESPRSSSSTIQAPEPDVMITISQLSPLEMAFQISVTGIRKMLDEKKSSKAFLVTGAMGTLDLSLEQIKSKTSWVEKYMQDPAYSYDFRRQSFLDLEEGRSMSPHNIKLEDGKQVVYALRYQAFRFKRFSKKLELIGLDTEHDNVAMY